MKQGPDEALFGTFDLPEARNLAGIQLRTLLNGGFPDLRPHDLFSNPRFMGKPIAELVARSWVGNSGGHRQHGSEELPAPLIII